MGTLILLFALCVAFISLVSAVYPLYVFITTKGFYQDCREIMRARVHGVGRYGLGFSEQGFAVDPGAAAHIEELRNKWPKN